METTMEIPIDTQRRAELAGHAVELLRLNRQPLVGRNHVEVIAQAVGERLLHIDTDLGVAIGMPQLAREVVHA